MAALAAHNSGSDWRDSAMDALKSFAASHDTFTTEQVRHSAIVPKPTTDKAWGQITLQAKRDGLIEAIGNVKVASGRMVAALWKSSIFNPTI